MKLLLDENLSRRLVPALQAQVSGSSAWWRPEATAPAWFTWPWGNTSNDAVLAALLAAAAGLHQAFEDAAVGVVVIG